MTPQLEHLGLFVWDLDLMTGFYTRALGLEMDGRGFGMGTRGQRFAIVVKDGVAADVQIEAPKEFKVSAAEHILSRL